MSNGRSAFPGRAGVRSARRRRSMTGILGGIAVSGLILGGLAGPVVADDVTGGGNADAYVGIQGDCVVVGAGTGGSGESADQPGDGTPSGGDLSAAGNGSTEASVCRTDVDPVVDDVLGAVPDDPGDVVPGDVVPGDPGDLLPGDPGDVLPGDPGDVLPGDPGDVLPGDPGDLVPGDPGDLVPGDPGDVVPADPGDVVPGDLDGAVPGDPAELVPDGFGPGSDVVNRLARILPGLSGTDTPGGGHVDRPATVMPPGGSDVASDGVGGADEAPGAPEDHILGARIETVAADQAGTSAVPAGATLPRTGGAPGAFLLRFVAFAAAGRGLLRLAGRRTRGRP